MDQDLINLLSPGSATVSKAVYKDVDKTVRFLDDVSPEIEVNGRGGARRYTLKPLSELYGPGTGLSSVDPTDDRFLPLLLSIEEEICRYYDTIDPGLTDGKVLLALKPLTMSPEAEPTDALSQRISLALRLNLSLNDYSRQDVKGALRQVAKSVERHTKAEGRRGYLAFIQQFVGSMRRG